MKHPPEQVLSLMTVAAELRAGGASWEMVAAKVGREARTCRSWPQRYPDDWERLFGAAADRLLADAGAEALHFLRKLLRSETTPLGQNTAKFLYSRWRESRPGKGKDAPAVPGDWGPFLAYLESLDDAAVQAFLQEFLARRLAQAGAAVPAGGGPAGPAVGG
jgi:hypothetical protein